MPSAKGEAGPASLRSVVRPEVPWRPLTIRVFMSDRKRRLGAVRNMQGMNP